MFEDAVNFIGLDHRINDESVSISEAQLKNKVNESILDKTISTRDVTEKR